VISNREGTYRETNMGKHYMKTIHIWEDLSAYRKTAVRQEHTYIYIYNIIYGHRERERERERERKTYIGRHV